MSDERMIINTAKAAEILQMTSRRVIGLCHEGKLEGAVQIGRNWKIPEVSVRRYGEAAGIIAPESEGIPAHTLLPCAVGNTSFVEIASECYYADKTLLIRDLVDDHNMVTLFTRPRRFGKTLAVNMLKTFFEKSDEDTSRYFADKKIWQCGEKYRALQGSYPVILLTFKDVKYGTFEDSMEAIRLILNRESGEGLFDLQLEPKEKGIPGIIMEFKTVPSEEKAELSAYADEALEQIKRKKYTQDFKDRGIQNIIQYGIAFSGKRVEVKTACIGS